VLNSNKICVLGEGAWGTAIAKLLANNGLSVNLWCHNPDISQAILNLDTLIKPTPHMQEALQDVDWIFEAIPVKFLRSVIEKSKPHITDKQIFVILSKGIEQDTLLFPTQIIDEVLGFVTKKAVISGPSFAHDLNNRHVTAVNIASSNMQITQDLIAIMKNNYFYPKLSNDIIGLQVCGAIKNVIALGLGIADSSGCGDNTKAFLLTVGLQEMALLNKQVGGYSETVYDLAGIGDLVLSCFGSHGRNFLMGKQLGEGKKSEDIFAQTGFIPEGINTVQSVKQLIDKTGLDLPLCSGIYNVIFNNLKFSDLLKTI